jgi:hypothetical protein
MDWPSVLTSVTGSVAVAVALSNVLSNRSIERYKVQQSRALLETQNAFSVGATSHMATVAWDKHIEFCEAYVEEMYKALHTLIPDGRTEEPVDVRNLSQIRQSKRALWFTREIEDKLKTFDRDITQIGASRVLDADGNGPPVANENSIKTGIVIAYLRGALLTEELTVLRNKLVIGSSTKPAA